MTFFSCNADVLCINKCEFYQIKGFCFHFFTLIFQLLAKKGETKNNLVHA